MVRAQLLAACCTILVLAGCAQHEKPTTASSPQVHGPGAGNPMWAVVIDNIEACSCPAFCQCYFTGQPAFHPTGESAKAMRYCRFNNAFRVTQGHFGDTKLDGLTFWMGGDLGGDFSTGQMDWCVLRFEKSATPAQRKAVEAIVHAIFPVQWNSFTVGDDADIEWRHIDDGAVAKLNGGKSGEIILKQSRDADGKPAIVKNAQFWAAHGEDMYVMPAEVEAYRDGDKPFEYKKSNGFFTVVRMSSDDVKSGGHASAMVAGDMCCSK